MRDAGDYYDEKAKEARKLSEELCLKIAMRALLDSEIVKLRKRLEQARYVGD